jgi:hypothetical protein
MRRKRATADELIFMIFERIRANDPKAAPHPSFAVVPHPAYGWEIVIKPLTRRKYPAFVRHAERIQADLRKKFLMKE